MLINIALDRKEEYDMWCGVVDRICLATHSPEEYRKLRIREESAEEEEAPYFMQRLENIEEEEEKALTAQDDSAFIREILRGMKGREANGI